MTIDEWFPELDLSQLPHLVRERAAQLGIDLSKCEPGSTRVSRDSPGWLRIFVGFDPTHDLGTVSITALGRDTTRGTLN